MVLQGLWPGISETDQELLLIERFGFRKRHIYTLDEGLGSRARLCRGARYEGDGEKAELPARRLRVILVRARPRSIQVDSLPQGERATLSTFSGP